MIFLMMINWLFAEILYAAGLIWFRCVSKESCAITMSPVNSWIDSHMMYVLLIIYYQRAETIFLGLRTRG